MGDSTTESKNKKAHHKDGLSIPRFREDKFNLGNVLLSHTVTHAVPSALKGLTSVFGMGTGVTPSPWSPRISKNLKTLRTFRSLVPLFSLCYISHIHNDLNDLNDLTKLTDFDMDEGNPDKNSIMVKPIDLLVSVC